MDSKQASRPAGRAAPTAQELVDRAMRDIFGPPASEDPTDPRLPRCQAIEQIGFRSTQIIDRCDRPGTNSFDGRRVCPGHYAELQRQREVAAKTPIGWTSRGRIYR